MLSPIRHAGRSTPFADEPDQMRQAFVLGIATTAQERSSRCSSRVSAASTRGFRRRAAVEAAFGPERVHCVSMPYRFRRGEEHGRAPVARISTQASRDRPRVGVEDDLAVLAAVIRGARADLTEEKYRRHPRHDADGRSRNKFGWLLVATGKKSESRLATRRVPAEWPAGSRVVMKGTSTDRRLQLAQHLGTIPPSIIDRATERRAARKPVTQADAAVSGARPGCSSVRRAGPARSRSCPRDGFDTESSSARSSSSTGGSTAASGASRRPPATEGVRPRRRTPITNDGAADQARGSRATIRKSHGRGRHLSREHSRAPGLVSAPSATG